MSLHESVLSGKNNNAFVPNKLRYTAKEVCEMLGFKPNKLLTMEKEDPTFPRHIKDGPYQQSAKFYDAVEVHQWYESWKAKSRVGLVS